MNCKNCSKKLIVKHGQFINYLECKDCKLKFKQNEFLIGEKKTYNFKCFEITEYLQPFQTQNILILFSGFGISSKQTLNKARIYLNADEKKFHLISISHKLKYFDNIDNELQLYFDLISFLKMKFLINEKEINICGFSNGGIPILRLAEFYSFNSVLLISTVLIKFDAERIKKNNLIIFENLKDDNWVKNNNQILKQKLINNEKIFIEVDAGHNPVKSLQIFFNSIK